MNKQHLIIDGYNFMHRARSGFARGEFSIVFNFMRNLRALTELFNPDEIYFVIEGHPRARYEMMDSYKANRRIDPLADPKRHETMVDFHRQKNIIIGLLKSFFPIHVVRHEHHECDDVIYNLIDQGSQETEYIVVSNDTDFIQLLQLFDNVKLYNPMKKEFVTPPEYDYVLWKSLRGDGSDNIPGLPGISDKKAMTIVASTTEAADKFFSELSTEQKSQLAMNMKLIQFIKFTEQEYFNIKFWTNVNPLWDHLKISFSGMNFQSLLVEKTWNKFIATFDRLF